MMGPLNINQYGPTILLFFKFTEPIHAEFLKIVQMALIKTKEDISIYPKKRNMASTSGDQTGTHCRASAKLGPTMFLSCRNN